MTDKVLCPWCGNEMVLLGFGFDSTNAAWLECVQCGAHSPMSYDHDGTEDSAINAARAAALRRYEPQIRPMTLAQARERNNADQPLYVECKYTDLWHGLRPLNGWVVGFGWLRSWVEPSASPSGYIEGGYGAYWRCWPRKPTEEEREAYGWEDVK